MSKRKFFKNLFSALKNDAKKKHEITKGTFKKVKEAYDISVEEEKATNPDFKEFSDAKGFKEKTKVVSAHAKRDSKAALENIKKGLLQIKAIRENKVEQEEVAIDTDLVELDFEQPNEEIVVNNDVSTPEIEGPTLVKKYN